MAVVVTALLAFLIVCAISVLTDPDPSEYFRLLGRFFKCVGISLAGYILAFVLIGALAVIWEL